MQKKVTLAMLFEVAFITLPGLLMLAAGATWKQGVTFYVLAYGIPALGLVFTTLLLHRHGTHKSITLKPSVVMIGRIVTFVCSGMKVREWVAVHTVHHWFSDKPGDPHSPFITGFWRVYLWTAGLYHHAKKRADVQQVATEYPTDRLDRLVFDHGIFGPTVVLPLIQLAVLFLVFGISFNLLLVLATWPVAIAWFLHAGGVINAIGHTEMTIDPVTGDHSRNLHWIFRWVTWGEGSHHNHHLDKGAANFNVWWKDPGYCLVLALKFVGLTQVNRVAEWR